MQVTYLTQADVPKFQYKPVKMRTGGTALFLPSQVTYQLNDVSADGWISAPYGLSNPFGESTKQQLQLLIDSPALIATLKSIDAHNEELIKTNPEWTSGRKPVSYSKLLKETPDGRFLLNAKIETSGKNTTALWKAIEGTEGLAYDHGSVGDITYGASYAVRFTLWGMWTRPGNDFGMIANIDELLIRPGSEELIRASGPTIVV